MQYDHRWYGIGSSIGKSWEYRHDCNVITDNMWLQEWNNIGQSNTKTNLDISNSNLEIAKAAREDGQQMRSIALLTMIFLPATFVAVSAVGILHDGRWPNEGLTLKQVATESLFNVILPVEP